MANKTFTFPDGGNLYVEYSGNGNNAVSIWADPNEGEEDRELIFTFATSDGGTIIQRKVIQEAAPYTFDLSLITSYNVSVSVQLGWQYVNGTNVAQPFNLNGTIYNSNTTNYWTNNTTEHNYNVTMQKSIGNEYVFFANLIYDMINIKSVDINSTLPMVNLAYAFYNCRLLTSINSGVMNVTSMTATFNSCHSLTNLDGLANWNTSNVTTMGNTFCNCHNLTSLDGLANWDTSNVASMTYTFYNCYNLTSLEPLANWNTSNVTNMCNTFHYCYNLTSLEPLANWNTSNVTNMYEIFTYCSSLTSLDGLANWDVSNIATMGYTFGDCSSLTNVQGIFDAFANSSRTANTLFQNAFRNCSNIQGDITIKFNYITNAVNMFYGANNYLKNIYAYEGTMTYNSIRTAMNNSFNSELNCYVNNRYWNAHLYALED